jgi:hypothetical protein
MFKEKIEKDSNPDENHQLLKRRHDTHLYDTQHKVIQLIDTRHNNKKRDTQHNNAQIRDYVHNN